MALSCLEPEIYGHDKLSFSVQILGVPGFAVWLVFCRLYKTFYVNTLLKKEEYTYTCEESLKEQSPRVKVLGIDKANDSAKIQNPRS